MKQKLTSRANISAITILALLFSAQITLHISNPISISNQWNTDLATLLLGLMSVWCVFYKILWGNEYKRLSGAGLKVFWLSVIFIATNIILTMLRVIFQNRLTISISLALSILLVVNLFLLFDLGYLANCNFQKVISLFLTIINICALMLLLYYKGNVRTSVMTHFMGNMNIYIGMIFLITPLGVSYYSKNKENRFSLGILVGNFYTTTLTLILTGSRFGIWGFLFECLLIYLAFWGFQIRKQIFNLTAMIAVCVVLTCSAFSVINESIIQNIQRTLYYPSLITSEIVKHFYIPQVSLPIEPPSTEPPSTNLPPEDILAPPLPVEPPSPEDPTVNIPPQEIILVEPDDPSDPDNDGCMSDGSQIPITRRRMITRGINVLKKYWIFGTGRSAIFFGGRGYTSTHNFILDTLVCYGILGAVIYLMLNCYPFFDIIIRKNKELDEKLFIIGYSILFIFSMVEPLLSKLFILMLVWLYYITLLPRESGIQSIINKSTTNIGERR